MRNSGIKKNHKIYIFKHQQTESGGGGGANLEDNKTATIDVSAYTGPVAINPTAGKDGMKKATVTLSNIPSPSGSVTLYAWNRPDSESYYVYTLSATPNVGDSVYIGVNEYGEIAKNQSPVSSYTEGPFANAITVGEYSFARDSTKDIVLE